MRKAICFLGAALWSLTAFASGRELTPPEIRPYPALRPVVASNGTGFLAAWVPPFPANRIDVMPFDATGQARAAAAIPVRALNDVYTLDIARAGDGYVAAVLDGGGLLRLMYLDAEGHLIRSAAASAPLTGISDPRLVINGTDVMIVGRSYKGLTAYFMDDRGSVRSSTLVSPDPWAAFSVASSGDDFVIATGGVEAALHRFAGNGERIGYAIRFGLPFTTLDIATHDESIAIVGSDGSSQLLGIVAESGSTALQTRLLLRSDRYITQPKVLFTAGAFQVTFCESTDVTLSAKHRMSVMPFAADAAVRVQDDSDAFTMTSMAASDDVFLAVGEASGQVNGEGSGPAERVAWLANDPSTAKRDIISVHSIDQYGPAIATDGHDFLSVWWDGRVRAARIEANGNLIDSEPLVLSDDGWSPLVAFGDGVYLIVFQQRDGLRAVRMMPDGRIVDATAITTRGGASALGWNGLNFLIIGSDLLGVSATAITPDGIVTPPYHLSPEPVYDAFTYTYYGNSVIASTDDGRSVVAYLVTSGDQRPDSGPTDVHLEVVPIDALGRPSSDPIRLSGGSPFVANFAIAHGIGDEFLLVTEDGAGVLSSVIRNGSTLSISPSSRIFSWSSGAPNPTVSWNGSNYVVSWTSEASPPALWLWPPGTPLHSYVGLANVGAGGRIDELRCSRALAVDPSERRSIALAINRSRDTLVLTSEAIESGSERVIVYTGDDFTKAPTRPSPPTITQYLANTHGAVLQWAQDGSAIDGYVIEALWPEWVERFPDLIPGTERLAAIDRLPPRVTMRAFNAGGFSDPSTVATPQFAHKRAIGR